jgi:hypothetical protein
MLDSVTSALHLDTVEGAGIVTGLVVAGCLAFFWSRGHSDAQRLPGPPGRWIIGNAPDIPREKEWVAHEKLRRQYGMPMTTRNTGIAHVSQGRLWL